MAIDSALSCQIEMFAFSVTVEEGGGKGYGMCLYVRELDGLISHALYVCKCL